MLLSTEQSKWRIFILEVTPQICQTKKYEPTMIKGWDYLKKNELLMSKMLLVSEFIGSLQCNAWNPILVCKKPQWLPRVICKHLRIGQNGHIRHEAKAMLKRALVLKKKKICNPSTQFSFSSVSSKEFNLSLHRTGTYKCLFRNPSFNFIEESLATQLLHI